MAPVYCRRSERLWRGACHIERRPDSLDCMAALHVDDPEHASSRGSRPAPLVVSSRNLTVALCLHTLLSPGFALRDVDVHLFVCLFVCCLKRVLVGHWPADSSAIVLAAVSGRQHCWASHTDVLSRSIRAHRIVLPLAGAVVDEIFGGRAGLPPSFLYSSLFTINHGSKEMRTKLRQ